MLATSQDVRLSPPIWVSLVRGPLRKSLRTDPELSSHLQNEERELEASGLNEAVALGQRRLVPQVCRSRTAVSIMPHAPAPPTARRLHVRPLLPEGPLRSPLRLERSVGERKP